MNQPDKNLFNLLRILAAALVFYSHSYALARLPEPWILGIMSFGGLGVAMFFGISGYLVTTSFRLDPNPLRFISKRALRIMPALIVVSLLTAYVIGPVLTTLGVRDYLTSAATHLFVYKSIILSPRFDLPGVFAVNPYPHVVNGSLWTLPLEVAMYLIIACFFVLRSAKVQLGTVVVLFITALVLNHVVPMGKIVFYGSDVYQVIYHAPYFLVGSILSYHSAWVREHGHRLVLPLGIGLVALIGTPLINLAAWIAIPCITICLGEIKSRVASRLDPFGDVSYGIYLWSFPMQQIAMLWLTPKIGQFPAMLVAALVVVLVAKCSWVLVERPALQLKRKLPYAQR